MPLFQTQRVCMFIELKCVRATYDSGRSRTTYFDLIFYKHTTSLKWHENKLNFTLK